MKKNNFFILILILFFFTTNNLQSNEIYIVSKVNNQIITNEDVGNEIKYLILLNPKIKKLSENDLFFLSKNFLSKS